MLSAKMGNRGLLGGMLLLLVLLSACSLSLADKNEFDAFLDTRKTWVTWIAGNVSALYTTRCSAVSSCASRPCSKLACSNNWPLNFGSNNTGPGCKANTAFSSSADDTCGATCPGGSPLTYDQAVVRISRQNTIDDELVKRDLCVLSQPGLDAAFNNLFNLDKDRQQWLYFGSASGVFRIFPARAWNKTSQDNDIQNVQETCNSYDPRLRPWYVAAASGPKDVVIIFDVSRVWAIINDDQQFNRTKSALADVLGSLSGTDYISMIAVNSSASTMPSLREKTGPLPVLIKVSNFSGQTVKVLVNETLALQHGSTGLNLISGLDLAFQIFARSESQNSGCGRLILLVTDGVDRSGSSNSAVLDYVANQQSKLTRKAKILTYNVRPGLGNPDGTALLKALACGSNGTYNELSTSNPTTTMIDWYTHAGTAGLPAWSQAYASASGGLATTVSQAVFDTNGALLGVAGVDADYELLKNDIWDTDSTTFQSGLEDIYLNDSQAQCAAGKTDPKSALAACALEKTRRANLNCNGSAPLLLCGKDHDTCPVSPATLKPEEVLCQVGAYRPFKELVCCAACQNVSMTPRALPPPSTRPASPPSPPPPPPPIWKIIVGVVGGVAALVLLVGVLYYCGCCRKKPDDGFDDDPGKDKVVINV